MAVTRDPDKVLEGIANIYFGDKDEALPDENAVDYGGDWTESGSLSWEGVGYTEDGVEVEKSTDTEDVKPSETITPINVLVTGAGVAIRFVCMEHTLEMMKLAYGGGSIATTAAGAGQIGKRVLTLSPTLDSFALGFEVLNEHGFFTRMHVPHVKSVATVGTGYALNKIRMFPVEFRALCEIDDITFVEKTAVATS